MAEYDVDARRMLCPMPVIRLQNTINKVTVGDIVRIVCTDPGSVNDIAAWCRINGHELASSESVDGEFHFTVVKGESS